MFDGLTIGFIGGGVMAEAMISGLLKQTSLTPTQIYVSDVSSERGQVLHSDYGICFTLSNSEVAQRADLLVLSIKPQVLDKVLAELHGAEGRIPKVVVSIIAGAHIQQLTDGLDNPNVIRAMPNTPARIGQGITVWTAAHDVPDLQREQTRAVCPHSDKKSTSITKITSIWQPRSAGLDPPMSSCSWKR